MNFSTIFHTMYSVEHIIISNLAKSIWNLQFLLVPIKIYSLLQLILWTTELQKKCKFDIIQNILSHESECTS